MKFMYDTNRPSIINLEKDEISKGQYKFLHYYYVRVNEQLKVDLSQTNNYNEFFHN